MDHIRGHIVQVVLQCRWSKFVIRRVNTNHGSSRSHRFFCLVSFCCLVILPLVLPFSMWLEDICSRLGQLHDGTEAHPLRHTHKAAVAFASLAFSFSSGQPWAEVLQEAFEEPFGSQKCFVRSLVSNRSSMNAFRMLWGGSGVFWLSRNQ